MTPTAIVTAIAVFVVFGFIFYGPSLMTPFQNVNGEVNAETSSQATPVTNLPPGLSAVDVVVGSGAEATPGKSITVNYTGMLTDGTQFDSSIGRAPFTFVLGNGDVIQGWEKGFAGMKEGGKRILTIAPELGYGANGAGGLIPPNATLIFEVELISVN